MKDQEPIEERNDDAQNGSEGDGADSPAPAIVMSMEEYDAMEQQLADALAAVDKNRDSFQRALADYNNLRRRTEQERDQMRADLVGKILNPFLDVLDDLDLAVQNRPDMGKDNGWVEGIELVYRKLQGKLDSQGVKVMEVGGADFDPHFHEAISHEPNDEFESGQVIAVVKPGYMIGDRVLRPAMVRVAA